MSFKITIAYNERLKDKLHVRDATIKMRESKEFVCASPQCTARLTFQEKHVRDQITKSRYYRLLPHEVHNNGCKYILKEAVNSIFMAASSKDLEVEKEKEQFVVRLNLVSEALKDNQDKDGSKKPAASNTENKDEAKINIKQKGKKSPYISLMRDIVNLRSMLENDTELADKVSLKTKRDTIKWKDFYYESDQLMACYDVIKNTGWEGKFEKKYLSHLACVEFKLELRGIKEKKGYYEIWGSQSKFIEPDENKILHVPKVLLRTDEKAIIDKIKKSFEDEDDKLTFLSWFTPSIKNSVNEFTSKNGQIFHYYFVEGKLYKLDQIAAIDHYLKK